MVRQFLGGHRPANDDQGAIPLLNSLQSSTAENGKPLRTSYPTISKCCRDEYMSTYRPIRTSLALMLYNVEPNAAAASC